MYVYVYVCIMHIVHVLFIYNLISIIHILINKSAIQNYNNFVY